jgi:aerotaxis receptor
MERKVAAEDLFFSTTNRKGIIDGANHVFCHYAQFAMNELLHAPHNIIRHPDVPAGVFHIMWDLLLSGYPMAGYVKNLAHDGVSYWVFATITPLGDGFLSVRQTPCRTDLFDAANGLYQTVLPMETAWRAAGLSRAESARRGAGELAEGIASLGLASYKDFIRLAVPAEVAARRELTTWTGRDPRDPGAGVTQDLIDSAIAVDLGLDIQMTGLNQLEELSGRLAAIQAQTGSSLDRLREAVSAAAAASYEVSDTEPVLGKIVVPLTTISQWLCDAFEELNARLSEVREAIAELRLRTALARLHDEMLAEFAREMAAGDAPERAPVYVQQLCRALEEAATTAAREVILTTEGLRSLAQDLGEVEGEMRNFQRQLATWRLLIPRYGLSRRLDPFTGPIDVQLNSGLNQIGDLRKLAGECVASAQPFNTAPMAAAVGAVTRARETVERQLT